MFDGTVNILIFISPRNILFNAMIQSPQRKIYLSPFLNSVNTNLSLTNELNDRPHRSDHGFEFEDCIFKYQYQTLLIYSFRKRLDFPNNFMGITSTVNNRNWISSKLEFWPSNSFYNTRRHSFWTNLPPQYHNPFRVQALT